MNGQLFENLPDLQGLFVEPVNSDVPKKSKESANQKELNLPNCKSTFQFIHVGELIRNIRPTDWLIWKFLEAKALITLIGSPGTYKSFMALSWGLSISTGIPWYGNKVVQGSVFYIAGEGNHGLPKRIKAWAIETGVDVSEAPFFISTAPVHMLEHGSARAAGEAILKLVKQHGEPAAIFIDTLARNFGPGDENSTADMSRFLIHLDKYLGFDCSKIIVHHTGHGNKDRGRGNSALIGATDAEFLLKKTGAGSIEMICRKMKDAPEAEPLGFSSQVVVVSNDFDEPITSIYLTCDGQIAPKTGGGLSKQMTKAISELHDLYQAPGHTQKNGQILLSDWRDRCMHSGIYSRSSFYKAVDRMKDRCLIVTNREYVYFTE